MNDASRRERLASLKAALDPDLVSDVGSQEIAGVRPSMCVTPSDGASLAVVLAGLHERELSALIQGGGTRMNLGNVPRPVDVLLSTAGLRGVRRFEPDDGVIEVAAGTPVVEVQEVVAAGGWQLPLVAPGLASTVGGVIASAAPGPRNLGLGPVRRAILGLEVVMASGERTRCGGQVVKNVTGYDLAKLYTGSLGTLGVIESAWLRLEPTPRTSCVRVIEFSQTSRALELGVEVSRRTSARACALLSPEICRRVGLPHSLAAAWMLVAEFAGEVAEVRQDAAFVEAAGGASPESAEGEDSRIWFDRIGTELIAEPEANGLRARIAVRPSKLAACCAPLLKGDTRLVVMPGMGLVYAEFPGSGSHAGGPRAVEDAISDAREAATIAGGDLVLEALPVECKHGHDVFDDCGPVQSIAAALKREFDPRDVLNPGRFTGAL